jgi:NACHT domain
MRLQKLQQSEIFDDLDQAAKSLLSALVNNETIFTTEINSQTVTITDLHLETRSLIQKEATKTREEILNALKLSESVSMDHKSRHDIVYGTEVTNSWNEHNRIQDMILQSLRFPTMNDRYETIKAAHAKTFEWIFRKFEGNDKPWDDFSDWLQHGEGIYWISGKAGSGKSTLMRYIQDNPRLRTLLRTWTTQDNDLVVAKFFFWISGVSDQASQVGLLRGLLYELLNSKRHLIEATLPDFWSSLSTSVSPIQYSQTYSWTLARVSSCFKKLFSIISQDSSHVFLLIDGLDEYQGDPADTVELLQSIVSPNVKICVSSRPWQVFEVAFRKTPKLRLQDLTFGDIKRYVDDKLLSSKRMQQSCSIDPVGASELVEEIVEKAQGVFLWITLVVKSFLNGFTNGDSISYLRKRLEEIPSEIEDLYSYMLSKVESIYYEEGRKLFSIVSVSFQIEAKYVGDPICALRLAFAMGDKENLKVPWESVSEEEVIKMVEWIDSRLRICCAGLLEVSSNHQFNENYFGTFGNREIQYIHRTGRDFLVPDRSSKKPSWIYPVITDEIPVRIMRSNVIYLKALVQGNAFIERRRKFLNRLVVRMMWLAYKAEQETSHHHAEILDAFKDSAGQLFGSSSEWMGKFIGSIESDEDSRRSWCTDFLCLAIVWGLNLYLDCKLGQGTEVLEAKRGRPYLDYALRYIGDKEGREEQWDLKTISILLDHGGDPNLHCNLCIDPRNHYLTQSTPWEAVLYKVSLHRSTMTTEIFSSLLAPLFELMLSHGADPHATDYPVSQGQIAKKLGKSVTDIVSQYLKSCPEKSSQLLQLLDAAKKKPRLPKNVSRISRLKKRIKFRKSYELLPLQNIS